LSAASDAADGGGLVGVGVTGGEVLTAVAGEVVAEVVDGDPTVVEAADDAVAVVVATTDGGATFVADSVV
jgi:hypothetical protein